MKQLQIRIYPDGRVETKTLGIKGSACEKYLETFEKLTRAEIVDSEYTSEFLETDTVIENNNELFSSDVLENRNG